MEEGASVHSYSCPSQEPGEWQNKKPFDVDVGLRKKWVESIPPALASAWAPRPPTAVRPGRFPRATASHQTRAH